MRNPNMFRAESPLSPSELLTKLNRVTTDEFDTAKTSRNFQYYGRIDENRFEITNVRFGPHSTGPNIHGEIEVKPEGGTVVTFKIDIDEHKNYIRTILMLALGVIAVGASIITISEKKSLYTVIAFLAVMVIFPIVYAAFVKQILKSTQKGELKKILTVTESTPCSPREN